MDNIIITVTNLQKAFLYDLEVPRNQTVDRLKDDIIDTLNSYDPSLFLKTSAVLFCNRMGKQLQPNETLDNAGVWNGDYITIIEV